MTFSESQQQGARPLAKTKEGLARARAQGQAKRWLQAAGLGLGAAGLIGTAGFGVSLWSTGQRLQAEVRQSAEFLDAYLAQSRRVLRIMKLLVERDGLDPRSEPATARELWKLATQFSDVGYLNYGLSNGDFRGVGQLRSQSGSLVFERSDASSFDSLHVHRLGATGAVGRQFLIKPWSDFRQEDWYRKPFGQTSFTWSGIYNWTDDPSVMVIGAGIGISQAGRPLGTAGVDLFTDTISFKLQQIGSSSGDALAVTEPNGLVVATSTVQQPFEINDQTVKRYRLQQLSDPRLRHAAGSPPGPVATPHLAFRQGELVANGSWLDGMGLQLQIIAAAPCTVLLQRWIGGSLLLAVAIGLIAARQLGRGL